MDAWFIPGRERNNPSNNTRFSARARRSHAKLSRDDFKKKKVLRSCARCHRYKNTNPCASSPPNHLEPYHHGKDIAIRFQRYLIELIPELIGPLLLQIRIWCYLIAIYERSRHWYHITARSYLLVTRHHEHSRG